MTHTLVDDVQSYIDECETILQCTLDGSVETVVENINEAQTAVGNIESELRYVNDELEEKEDIVTAYEDIGDIEECQAYKDDLEAFEALGQYSEVEAMVQNSDGGTEMADLRETLRVALESVAQKQAAIDLLEVLNKSQAERIKGARIALLTDADTGLSKSQVDYMEYLRNGEPQDVVLARGVELKLAEFADKWQEDNNDNAQPLTGDCLCPPSTPVQATQEVEWPVDANGSPLPACDA